MLPNRTGEYYGRVMKLRGRMGLLLVSSAWSLSHGFMIGLPERAIHSTFPSDNSSSQHFMKMIRAAPFKISQTSLFRSELTQCYFSSYDFRSTKDLQRQNNNTSTAPATPKEAILATSPTEDHKIIQSTLDWLENVVMGMGLCPFAEKPWNLQQVHVEVIAGRDEETILGRVLGECLIKKNVPGTSLMVCPDLHPKSFEKFLEVHNMLLDGVLVDNDLTDDIQVAPFHPLFEFDGSGSDGVDNYTNRSPYPIFHILREEEVSRAVELLQGDASKVWGRNVQLLQALEEELEEEQIKQVMLGTPDLDQSIRTKVQTILQNVKKARK